jgi:hypothetical protein
LADTQTYLPYALADLEHAKQIADGPVPVEVRFRVFIASVKICLRALDRLSRGIAPSVHHHSAKPVVERMGGYMGVISVLEGIHVHRYVAADEGRREGRLGSPDGHTPRYVVFSPL